MWGKIPRGFHLVPCVPIRSALLRITCFTIYIIYILGSTLNAMFSVFLIASSALRVVILPTGCPLGIPPIRSMTDAEEAVYEHPTASDTIIEAR